MGMPIKYVMLCYVMLCYVMLCYVMLCYVMLCYVKSRLVFLKKSEAEECVRLKIITVSSGISNIFIE